jgi:anti-sigma factor ChrR (cupin superfamily)
MTDELQEQAALYAAGALPAEEAVRFEELLATDEAARRAAAAHDATLTHLFRAAPPVAPSPGVREALLKRAGLPAGVTLLRAQEGQWEETPYPGVLRRWLHRGAGGARTFLLKMAPGAVLPAHPHTADEECLVLEGDVRSFDLEMRAGDFFRGRAGTMHQPSTTSGGCLLLLQYRAAEGGAG